MVYSMDLAVSKLGGPQASTTASLVMPRPSPSNSNSRGWGGGPASKDGERSFSPDAHDARAKARARAPTTARAPVFLFGQCHNTIQLLARIPYSTPLDYFHFI